jgi:hypothetical protein
VRTFLFGLGIGLLVCIALGGVLAVIVNRLPEARQSASTESPTEYSVIVKIKLSDDKFGTDDEVAAGFALEDDLMRYFDEHSEIGEFDGDGVGFGYFDLYMYTSNPDSLIDQITPIVRNAKPPTGSHIIRHITETGADEKRFDL